MASRPEASGWPVVLVLLAARNGQRFIARQIASVLSQRDVGIRVVVRDDGSSDGTRAMVADIARQDARLTLMPDHDPSGSASANFFRLIAGARLDDATHVAFCDQDDEWRPDKLARAVACMRETGSSGYSSAVEAVWADGRRKRLAQDPRARRADHLFEGAGQGCTFVFDAALFRQFQRDLADHAELLPALHYHDWTLYALARASGVRWHFDARPSMLYHQHSGNDTGARSSAAGVRRRLALIRQGWYRGQVDAIVRMLRAARPAHEPAVEWQRLSRSRAARLGYVIRHGRRRLVDRAILAAAVILGYL